MTDRPGAHDPIWDCTVLAEGSCWQFCGAGQIPWASGLDNRGWERAPLGFLILAQGQTDLEEAHCNLSVAKGFFPILILTEMEQMCVTASPCF